MLPVLITAVSGFFTEVGSSLGKRTLNDGKTSIYAMGTLKVAWGLVFFLVTVALFGQHFIFSQASLPTFGVRVVLEILQVHSVLLALGMATRSTFGFLRILTIPLLLGVDIMLGYTLSLNQIIGVGVIVIALIFLFVNRGIEKKGSGLVLFGAVNAVATISLYKYNITHYNSVAGEEITMYALLLAYFLVATFFIAKENPFAAFTRKELFFQSVIHSVGTVVLSYAYTLTTASIITTAKRSLEVLWSVLSGNFVFKEERFMVKAFSFLLVVVGIVLLV
ncbi:MAG: hypothetical protein A2408_00795 [Candidatus Yonathbacteria bacterium RIFOXYC1_FULL_52_10]|uniref:EamA domain-containing protein n=1 Tax=Candidatus Yonathbacteria bacterium RIFOXYD1_FULL_52_36 TaxID=1802730 RepID=A0A1G2SKK0_9BACT|nr:MAG: hypothetical protein A2408_00795 [Candidatus Yonathbacteria bacterium RIFOXYC1_FULL_52_10]OHA85218.1 MAG: hypothetical protein A2591_03940 [Candidatus Yonathbacteria bacterium RIFOXYD1_FULL_52_36]